MAVQLVGDEPAASRRCWLGQNAYIDAAHRVQARVEDAIRTGKATGLGHFPSFDFQVNAAWLTASMIAAILLAWLKLLALDGDLARAEPKTLRYGSCTPPPPGARAAPLSQNPGHLAVGRCDHHRVAAHRRAPASPLTSTNRPAIQEGAPRGLWNPRPPGPPAGLLSYTEAKIRSRKRPATASASHQPL